MYQEQSSSSRPDLLGSSDVTEVLYTNHFGCSLANDIPLYQYDVAIDEMDFNTNQWKEVKGRARCAQLIPSFITDHQLHPNVFVWYDEQKCLYSTNILPTPQVKPHPDGRSQFRINALVQQWSTSDVIKYINGQTKTFPTDAIRILETLLKKSIQDRIDVIKNKCYFKNEPARLLDNGLEKRRGFIQSLHLSSGLLTLNIQTKLTTFYSNIPLLEFIAKQIGHEQNLSTMDMRKLNQVLDNCLIVTRQSQWQKAYVFSQFDLRTPSQIPTQQADESLVEYFAKKNIILTRPDDPCIEVYSLDPHSRPCYLPLELCRIKKDQVYIDPVGFEEGETFIPTPEGRYNAILDALNYCDYNSPANSLCKVVDFRILTGEMLNFNARILSPPAIAPGITYSYSENVDKGRIRLQGSLYRPIRIPDLAITYFGSSFNQNKDPVNRFTKKLVEVMDKFDVYQSHQTEVVEPHWQAIDEYFQSMDARQCKFIVCVMDAPNEAALTILKGHIKRCGSIKYGIMTQCVRVSEMSQRNYCENLVRKINWKNGGMNTKVNLNIALKTQNSERDLFMFIGADVIHPTNVTRQHPSIAAMVGSGNGSCSIAATRVAKQYPKEGKCSMEIILPMREMIEQLLVYNLGIHERLPTKIVFYRDGIDDGQFSKVLNYEIPQIRLAFANIYGENPHPRLTFIIVKKRHNTRFFTYKPNQPHKETDNMSIGALIDHTIVHPYENNFYLNSHNAYRGVNHPTLYHVLLDEMNWTSNELQLLTYHLCFTDARSSASEAIPSVVHQADVAALKARDLFCDHQENASANNTVYEMLNVHPRLKDLPVLG